MMPLGADGAIGTDRGDVIVAAMIEALGTRGILLPAPTNFGTDRPGRSRARPKAGPKNLVEGLEQRTIAELEALIAVSDDRDRTALAWVRDWPEAPTQKNLVGVVERLQFVRSLGVGSDREQRIIARVIGRSPRKRLFSAPSIFRDSIRRADWQLWSCSPARWKRS